MSVELETLIENCESALREGNAARVAELLQELEPKDVPRAHCLTLANISRRANLLPLGLKLLMPYVRPSRGAADPSSAELAEYAVLLERSGAPQEALGVLAQVDTAKSPEAHLYRTFCHFKSWSYDLAIPELNAYLALPLAPYSRLVANVNLGAALVITRAFEEALPHLRATQKVAADNGYGRLKANCHELMAQVHFHLRDSAAALADLNEAEKILGNEKTSDKFFVKKWQNVIAAQRSRNPALLDDWRAAAVTRRDWESVREADLFRLSIAYSQNDFDRLYFGSPFAGYRARITSELQRQNTSRTFLYGRDNAPCFDLKTGLISGGESLNAGKKVHQLLGIMLSDLYQPWRIAALFSKLYPDEYFNIFSSPARVHQIIFRARQWLFENQIPVELAEEHNAYRLVLRGDFAFRLSLANEDIAGPAAQWNRLILKLGPRASFTAKEARALLDLSVPSCKRLLKWAVENQRVLRTGTNVATVYHLRANQDKAAA